MRAFSADLCKKLQDENTAFAVARNHELLELRSTVMQQQKGTPMLIV